MSDTPILDLNDLGRRLRAARLLRGMSADDVVAALSAYGIDVTRRTINAYERGDWMLPLDAFFALAVVLAPEQGVRYFTAALSPQMRQAWLDAFGDGSRGAY